MHRRSNSSISWTAETMQETLYAVVRNLSPLKESYLWSTGFRMPPWNSTDSTKRKCSNSKTTNMERTKEYTVEAKITLRITMDDESDLAKAMDELDSNISQSDLICVNGCVVEGKLNGFAVKTEGKPEIIG